MSKITSVTHLVLCKGLYKVYALITDLTRGHPYFAKNKIKTGSILIASTLAMCTYHQENKSNSAMNSASKDSSSKKMAIAKLADTIKKQVTSKEEIERTQFSTCYIEAAYPTEPLDTISQVESPDNDPIYYIVEDSASFPGGTDSLYTFIKRTLQYPKSAKETGIEGYVIVSFVITKMGDVSNVEVLRGLNTELDAEAVRIVKSIPRWKPAWDKGKLVQVYQTIPIHFNLEN